MSRTLLFLGFSILLSCTYDNEEELLGKVECETNPPSYILNVKPILEASCAISGCHVTGQQLPDLTSMNSVRQNALRVKNRVENRTMPPTQTGMQLTQEEIHTISCWVDGGAIEN